MSDAGRARGDQVAATNPWSPDPNFPQDPEFYRRVLDHMPSPLIVVDANGEIVYGNRAMIELSGWALADGVGTNILSYLHPDDVRWVTDAFLAVTSAPGADALEDDPPWAAIHFRIIARDGSVVPLEVTGTGGLADDVVSGVIYDVRPARTHDLLRQTLIGSAAGEDVDALLGHVVRTISVPPLELDAAVLEPDPDGGFRAIASTSPLLRDALQLATDEPVPWSDPVDEPTFVDAATLPDPMRGPVADAGFVDLWHVAARSSVGAVSYRIVAGAPIHHVPDTGVRDRMRQARELAGVVLLRAQTDAMLAHAATHDPLTGLPNRAGFAGRAEELGERIGAVLFVDLDGFKPVNDRYGHAAGDEVLRVVAERLRRAARATDLIGRLGGDEFALILTGADRTAGRSIAAREAEAAASRVIDAVSAPITLPAELVGAANGDPRVPADGSPYGGRRADDATAVRVVVTASVGIALARNGVVFDTLLTDADHAMYVAKRDGGRRAHVAG